MTTIPKDSKRGLAAQALIDAAHEFWKACNAEGQYGEVQWLTDDEGALLIFTRGEYRQHLLTNIQTMPGVHTENMFSEELEGEQQP